MREIDISELSDKTPAINVWRKVSIKRRVE